MKSIAMKLEDQDQVRQSIELFSNDDETEERIKRVGADLKIESAKVAIMMKKIDEIIALANRMNS